MHKLITDDDKSLLLLFSQLIFLEILPETLISNFLTHPKNGRFAPILLELMVLDQCSQITI